MSDESLRLAGIEVRGHSVGGLETFIRLPELGLCFDIGRAPESSLSTELVLFTHSHIDHLGGVSSHAASRALRGMGPPTYVVPPPIAPGLQDLLEVWRGLDGANLPCKIVPLGPGDELTIKGRRVVRPFPAHHFGAAQGYVVWDAREKLLPELAGLSGDEIKARREAGEPVTARIETPLVAFTGDSRIDVLDVEPVLYQAKLLILEVTFLDDRVTVESAREKGHVHLDEVIERADRFQNEAILMTHFSARYNRRQVREILAERLPASLAERVTPLLNHFS
ncbi:MAG: MBL fold metallo-hydrolase [Planctomycetota bacterium]|nr:MBL fold metallo-hydrolase [Planctomycetota bacterium]